MKIQKNGTTLSVDLHGMRVEDARFRLDLLLKNTSAETKEVLVVHGFNGGHALRDMVREDFKNHPRVRSVLKTLTDGQTRLILK